ncbi:MAG: amino acid permease [Candidatus Aenigmarchaeota archaeon]|nr:amino acid permease [Candidatus Aenigmarchaeota archaeon]
MPKLKKSLGLFEATLYGVGIILGAGIYALLGVGAGIAGNALWISFMIAAFIATFTGLSYAELSSMYPKEAAEYVYTKKAFNIKMLSFIVSWIMVVVGIVSAATVALGFAGYFSHMIGGPPLLIAGVLIAFMSMINYCGMKESSSFNVVATIAETAGLVIIIALGLYFFGTTGNSINYFEVPETVGMAGILSATALIFFAYIGFEQIANMSEETKNAKKVIPKALLLSIVITTVIYILVAVSAISILGWEELSQSKAPLTAVVSRVMGSDASLMMSILALFATSNTVLVLLVVTSRILYGMSCQHSLPKRLGRIGRRGTPYTAVFVVMLFSITALFIGRIGTVAMLTTLGTFIVYLFINLALMWLRYKKPRASRSFKVPFNIGKFPVIAFLGIVSSAAMLFYFEPMLLLYEAVLILIGIGVYKIFNK